MAHRIPPARSKVVSTLFAMLIGCAWPAMSNAMCFEPSMANRGVYSYPKKRIIEVGYLADYTIGRDRTDSFLRGNFFSNCESGAIHRNSNVRDFVLESFTIFLGMAEAFAYTCPDYRINDRQVALYAQYFLIFPLKDGRLGNEGHIQDMEMIRRPELRGYIFEMMTDIDEGKSCASLFNERFRFLGIF